ncbi:MAG: RpiB/LacA/LacB family sugar-phosphate isomerase, partial [Bacteroidota bacterium]
GDSVDYPDFAHPVAEAVENGTAELGILMCGSGNGINMSANKHAAIRAALSWTPEIAALARQHNNANVLTLPARFISEETAVAILDSFLAASFEGGRHERRVNKISC